MVQVSKLSVMNSVKVPYTACTCRSLSVIFVMLLVKKKDEFLDEVGAGEREEEEELSLCRRRRGGLCIRR